MQHRITRQDVLHDGFTLAGRLPNAWQRASGACVNAVRGCLRIVAINRLWRLPRQASDALSTCAMPSADVLIAISMPWRDVSYWSEPLQLFPQETAVSGAFLCHQFENITRVGMSASVDALWHVGDVPQM